MKTRAERELNWWNEAYRREGAQHAHCWWLEYQEQVWYSSQRFNELARGLARQKVLSLGGGVDRLAVLLAADGRAVVSVDVSPVAVSATAELARQSGLAARLTALAGTAEEVALAEGSFDLVLCKRALHHMALDTVLPRVHSLLAEDGVFLALEPFCLLRPLAWIHRHLPFHPYGMTEDERELNSSDLAQIRRIFRHVQVSYHDLLSRESVAFLLCRAGLGRLLQPLGQWDWRLVNHLLPWLRHGSTWLMIQASK